MIDKERTRMLDEAMHTIDNINSHLDWSHNNVRPAVIRHAKGLAAELFASDLAIDVMFIYPNDDREIVFEIIFDNDRLLINIPRCKCENITYFFSYKIGDDYKFEDGEFQLGLTWAPKIIEKILEKRKAV